MEIRPYLKADETKLFDLMHTEGKDWECYWGESGRTKYIKALHSSLTYIALEKGTICGYVRCRDDDGLGVYIYDLLVDKAFRGHAIGRKLMERVCADFPENEVYVMSGVDGYYQKLGYQREGSVYRVHTL